MASSLNFKNIPEKARLIGFGDCFRLSEKSQWQIECHFLLLTKEVQLINMPIEALPLLAINRKYDNGGISLSGWEGKTELPEQNGNYWTLQTIADVPNVLIPHQKKEWSSQKVFRVRVGQSFIWIPAIELARFFLLKTGINTRYAFYEGNLNAMASVETENNKIIIRLDSRYPKGLLDNKAHQEYLAWLILNKSVQNSFSSIYEKCNAEAIKKSLGTKWTFNFNPFDMSGTCLEWRGLHTKEGSFVKEIIAASNIKNMIQQGHEIISISHPKDLERQHGAGFTGLGVAKDIEDLTYEIDDQEDPSSWSQHRILMVPKGGFSYSNKIETQRLYKKTTVKAGKFKDEKNESETVIKVGITEGSYPSNVVQSDYDCIDESGYEEQKFNDICDVTKYIHEANPDWVFSSWKIDLPTVSQKKSKKKGYKFYFIGNKRRQCYCARIEILSSKILFFLEIDLSDNRKLSTLILQLKDNGCEENVVINGILRDLVRNAGHWNRAKIDKVAETRSYCNHPSGKSLNKSNETIDVWAIRLMREINAQI